jgi:hypothetical protein
MRRRVPDGIALHLALLLLLAHLVLVLTPTPPPPPFPPPRPRFASLTCPCCRLGPPGPRSLTPRLVVLQERRPRGRLTTLPHPRPRRLPAHFRPNSRHGRLLMHARWPRAPLCPCRRRPPRRNRVRCWRLVPPRRSTRRLGRSPCTDRDRWVRWGEEAHEEETWDRVTEPFIRASGIDASGVGFGLLRHREDLVVRRSGRQKEGRREAPRQALLRAPRLRVVGRLLRSLDNLGRAAAGAGEATAASAHAERVDGALSRLVPPPPPLRPKALLRQKEESGKLEEELNAALHKTSAPPGRVASASARSALVYCACVRTLGYNSSLAPGRRLKTGLWVAR